MLPNQICLKGLHEFLMIAGNPVIRGKNQHKLYIEKKVQENLDAIKQEFESLNIDYIKDVMSFNSFKSLSKDFSSRNKFPSIVACESSVKHLVRNMVNKRKTSVIAFKTGLKTSQDRILHKSVKAIRKINRSIELDIPSTGSCGSIMFGHSNMEKNELVENCTVVIKYLINLYYILFVIIQLSYI